MLWFCCRVAGPGLSSLSGPGSVDAGAPPSEEALALKREAAHMPGESAVAGVYGHMAERVCDMWRSSAALKVQETTHFNLQSSCDVLSNQRLSSGAESVPSLSRMSL